MTYGAELETGNVAEFEINGLVGGNFANGRGNMTAYASYYNREGVLQSEYDYSRASAGLCYDSGQGYFVCDSAAEAYKSASSPAFCSLVVRARRLGAGSRTTQATRSTRLGTQRLPGQFGAANTDCNPNTAPVAAVNGGNLSFNDAGQLTPRFTAGACGVPDRAAGSSRYNLRSGQLPGHSGRAYRIVDERSLRHQRHAASERDVELR